MVAVGLLSSNGQSLLQVRPKGSESLTEPFGGKFAVKLAVGFNKLWRKLRRRACERASGCEIGKQSGGNRVVLDTKDRLIGLSPPKRGNRFRLASESAADLHR